MQMEIDLMALYKQIKASPYTPDFELNLVLKKDVPVHTTNVNLDIPVGGYCQPPLPSAEYMLTGNNGGSMRFGTIDSISIERGIPGPISYVALKGRSRRHKVLRSIKLNAVKFANLIDRLYPSFKLEMRYGFSDEVTNVFISVVIIRPEIDGELSIEFVIGWGIETTLFNYHKVGKVCTLESMRLSQPAQFGVPPLSRYIRQAMQHLLK